MPPICRGVGSGCLLSSWLSSTYSMLQYAVYSLDQVSVATAIKIDPEHAASLSKLMLLIRSIMRCPACKQDTSPGDHKCLKYELSPPLLSQHAEHASVHPSLLWPYP